MKSVQTFPVGTEKKPVPPTHSNEDGKPASDWISRELLTLTVSPIEINCPGVLNIRVSKTFLIPTEELKPVMVALLNIFLCPAI